MLYGAARGAGGRGVGVLRGSMVLATVNIPGKMTEKKKIISF